MRRATSITTRMTGSAAAAASSAFSLGSQLRLAVIAVVIVFFRMLKRTPETQLPVEPAEPRALAAFARGNGGELTEDLLVGSGRAATAYRRSSAPGLVTVETLNQLVRENPASVSQAKAA